MSLISVAHAAGEGTSQGGGFEMLIMLGMFAVIFYFMIFRPQSKRVKEHKNLMASMAKGDEVLTSGGLVGKITKIADDNDFISIELNHANEVVIKKDFVTAVLPKGTLKSL
ncbi:MULTISPECIES: preprotein translocase subunit YajC [Vibrio]|uniref:preprotein translocase subunit YajC n=1 Tax=Vibrio TaxID=662 RepID=UPI000C1676FE|nr:MULTISPECIES: preprotein translocase subunit YajC [Vibrio]NAW70684.1 preprotein translocase subunit YajC [Vibrio sp. V28_P6S34P95]NAX05047.1 preprotein translocase subunit YajC [Vibrio sp. V30_P3S12P165]NAX34502.1 preprotein translocase subunit YajC [Vibrio sp. V29_P1S30P107]NAX36439.1 preprotein translocase subunit YajC [Vibrio sp. V27_P1S3P104]NAX40374.1 preprotein translocase subunit YajC [Vibrio sp. V26_P1S5P106]